MSPEPRPFSTRSVQRRGSVLSRRWAADGPPERPATKPAPAPEPPPAPTPAVLPDGEALTLDGLRKFVNDTRDLAGDSPLQATVTEAGSLLNVLVFVPERPELLVKPADLPIPGPVAPQGPADKPTTIVVHHNVPSPAEAMLRATEATIARQRAAQERQGFRR